MGFEHHIAKRIASDNDAVLGNGNGGLSIIGRDAQHQDGVFRRFTDVISACFPICKQLVRFVDLDIGKRCKLERLG